MATRATSTGRRFDSPEQEAFLGLWRTYDRLRALEEELFGRYDLTPQQYNALRLLAGQHPPRRLHRDYPGRARPSAGAARTPARVPRPAARPPVPERTQGPDGV